MENGESTCHTTDDAKYSSDVDCGGMRHRALSKLIARLKTWVADGDSVAPTIHSIALNAINRTCVEYALVLG